jgi:hypothetical protein
MVKLIRHLGHSVLLRRGAAALVALVLFSMGGPLGSVAGQFIGGKIGGMLGKKAANAIH